MNEFCVWAKETNPAFSGGKTVTNDGKWMKVTWGADKVACEIEARYYSERKLPYKIWPAGLDPNKNHESSFSPDWLSQYQADE